MDSMEKQSWEIEPDGGDSTYWASVGVASLIFGIVTFVISLISIYLTINSEPTGSLFNPNQLLGTLACLVGAFGGMLATWHFVREHDKAIKLGRGALIGFLTGVGITVVSVILNETWQLIDPDMTRKMIDSVVANMEAMNMPEEQKQQIIDTTVESLRGQQNIGSQLLWNIPMFGLLNLLTGMIGAKIFGDRQEEEW